MTIAYYIVVMLHRSIILAQKETRRSGFLVMFGYKVFPTSQVQFLRLLERIRCRLTRHWLRYAWMYLRLHLRILLGLRPSPLVLPSLTICPIDYQSRPIIKYTSGYAILLPRYVGCWLIHFMVDLAGFEPASWTHPCRRDYNNFLST